METLALTVPSSTAGATPVLVAFDWPSFDALVAKLPEQARAEAAKLAHDADSPEQAIARLQVLYGPLLKAPAPAAAADLLAEVQALYATQEAEAAAAPAPVVKERDTAAAPGKPATYKPAKRERREFWQVSNTFFDWDLKMPPAYRLVWAAFHRYANGREGRQAKVTVGHLARACNVHKATAAQAVRYLAHLGAVVVLAEPKKVPDGTGRVKWARGRYYVPPVSTLDLDDLRQKIATAPKELLRTRPDEKRNRNRLGTMVRA